MLTKLSKEFKAKVLEECLALQEQKVETFKKEMNDAQQSANSEEKSTAGDKYDTARAMSQNVRDMNAQHLSEALKDLSVLRQLKTDVVLEEIKLGALTKTSIGTYFIATSLGQIMVEGEPIFSTSPAAPLIQALLHAKAGTEVQFRDRKIKILEVL